MAEDRTTMRATLLSRGQLVGLGLHRSLYYAFDGKVYHDTLDKIVEVGDYFEFMENLRAGKYGDVLEADNLTRRVYDLMRRHHAAARNYERGGNTEGARYLRYVENMLAALLRGQEAGTILPE